MRKWQKLLKTVDPVYWIILLLILVVVGVIWIGNKKITNLIFVTESQKKQIDILGSHLASATSSLADSIEETKVGLTSELEKERQNLAVVKEELGGVGSQVGAISGTVNTLEKLSKTDPELLQKYSKVFFLNEHYEPPRLSEISSTNRYFETRPMQVHQSVYPYLKELLNNAREDGQEIYVYSSYRSFNTQEALKGKYTVSYGSGANRFSADQGYSEHQLGTTVDLITVGIGGTLNGFGDTDDFEWLLNNAYKYGFVLSYPKNNSYYVYEPWHWRFVGVGLATYLKNQGQNFYDLDQRKIDTYLVNIFD